MDTMDLYRRAQDGFGAALAAVRDDQWETPSACAEWSVRDVAGHAVWGQHQLRAWATGEDYAEPAGAPGAPHPAVLAGADPTETWRTARAASDAVLTEEALRRPVSLTGLGEIPLEAVVTLLTTDLVAHRWDIGSATGQEVRFEPDLIAAAFAWARANIVRRPGFFGPELTPPPEAGDQVRLLAFLGRRAWAPVPA
ncbi:TIGR03086 family metal-binding protein [Amycolatopsis sp. cmx-4-68]|uniref:TIGR03086 family metal-binding protein n=1 Tax=Amycolatopsis sp. cmx-4-68 TaxID=2790938 RepID=UPI003979FE6A